MALVDSNYHFQYLDVGCEGRVADGGIWRKCSFHQWLRAGTLDLPEQKCWPNGEEFGPKPYTIVADDAFALSTYLLKPYATRDLSRNKRLFNYRLSRARRVSENAFGILGSRFRILLTNIYRSPDRVVELCRAVGVLHNYLRREGGNHYLGLGQVDAEDLNHGLVEGDAKATKCTPISITSTHPG